jgi:hypothetical protein
MTRSPHRNVSSIAAALIAGGIAIPAATLVAQTNGSSTQPNAAENASVTSQQGTPPAPRPPSPAPVGLAGQITDWLQIRGEYRGRLEGFANGGFNPDSTDGYLLDRFRFNVTIAPAKAVKFVVQAQDARTFDKTSGGQAVPYRDTLDLRMAYGEFGNAQRTVRIGRQELLFGDARLIGPLPWTNTARSFDGVRATIGGQKFKFDALAASVVTIRPDAFDKSGSGNVLYGFYGSSNSALPNATVEPYLFWRQSETLAVERGGTGDLQQATIGVRAVGKLPSGFDYGTELALQRGSLATDDVRAWAGHWVLGRTFAPVAGHPRIFAEYNYASGDGDPKDGNRGTFDQLYPTGHDKYGLADQVGWRNIEHLRGGVEIKPKAEWQVTGSYHTWWLANARDALYNAGGVAVARSSDGSAGRKVGQEIDAQAVYTYSPQLQLAGGYAYLVPGRFLEATTPGRSYGYSYLMVTYVFVGERPTSGGRQSR